MSRLRFVIITGMSGAGKTEAMRAFEDLGYFCVDNLPATLLPKFGELIAESSGRITRVAMVIDVRGGEFFGSLMQGLASLEEQGFSPEILFLEASDEVLVRRFKETRRRHPLGAEGGTLDGIRRERALLDELRGKASVIIDTSSMTAKELKAKIADMFGGEGGEGRMPVTVMSFGFKYGIPMDADMVFDVRFLPNPHYVESLRPLTGMDPAVKDYIGRWPVTRRYLKRVNDLLDFLMPQLLQEGRAHFIIAVGCTGGKHRSVYVAERIAEHLAELGYKVNVEHRDVDARENLA